MHVYTNYTLPELKTWQVIVYIYFQVNLHLNSIPLMNTTRKFLLLIALFIIVVTINVQSQSVSKKDLNYAKHPYWIAMIDDTTANYFETIKAYDGFWKNREKPKKEEETIGMKGATEKEKKEKSNWIKRLFENDIEKNQTWYTYQCKRYEHWKIMMQAYVQPDGTMLYPYQRLQLWQNARE